MIILEGWRAGKHLIYMVNNGIAAHAKLTDDLEFESKFLVVWEGYLLGRLVRDETKYFTLEGNSLATDVTGREDILYMRRDG
jgi:hypothetical protein